MEALTQKFLISFYISDLKINQIGVAEPLARIVANLLWTVCTYCCIPSAIAVYMPDSHEKL